jgi:hypothetical protein
MAERYRWSWIAAAVLLAPTVAGAHHLGSAYPDCKTLAGAAASASIPAGEVSVHGYGGFTIVAQELPAVPGVTPAPRYDTNYSGQEILVEGDVVATQVSLDFPGYLGGGTATVRTPGGAGTTTRFSGAMEFDSASFTGHYKIAKKQSYCESLLRRAILHNLYYEVTLNGVLTPTSAGSPLKGWGEATGITVLGGDTANH